MPTSVQHCLFLHSLVRPSCLHHSSTAYSCTLWLGPHAYITPALPILALSGQALMPTSLQHCLFLHSLARPPCLHHSSTAYSCTLWSGPHAYITPALPILTLFGHTLMLSRGTHGRSRRESERGSPGSESKRFA